LSGARRDQNWEVDLRAEHGRRKVDTIDVANNPRAQSSGQKCAVIALHSDLVAGTVEKNCGN
jgi:tricorn protease-like protein